MFAFNLVFPQLLPKANSAELLGEQALLLMGSEGRGRARNGVVAGASPVLLFGCSHPCQGTGWPRQHTSVRMCRARAGSWCCLHSPWLSWCFQEPALLTAANTETARADGTSRATACIPPGPLHGSALPSLLLLQAGLGLVVPSLPGPTAQSVELSAGQPPFLLGDGGALPVGWGCVSAQCHFWLHLHLWEMVILVHVAVLNCTRMHLLPHTPFLGRLQEALEAEKAPESWQGRIWARLVINLYLGRRSAKSSF